MAGCHGHDIFYPTVYYYIICTLILVGTQVAERWGNGIVVGNKREGHAGYEQAMFISQQQQLKDRMKNNSSKRKEAAAKHRSTTGHCCFCDFVGH
jgi:hypothetical protein